MIAVPVSVGELIDKLSILHVKQTKITNSDKLKYINEEFELLCNFSSDYLNDKTISEIYHELVKTNSELWEIEDKLRLLESNSIFDSTFIELARNVYFTNDKRFELKNKINLLTNSEIREQKHYVDYKKP